MIRTRAPFPTFRAAALGAALASLPVAGMPVAGMAENWSGAYFGGSLGVATSAENEDLRSLHGGVMRMRGRAVFGAEMELAETDIGTSSGPIDRIARIKGSAGAVTEGLHYYASAGLAVADGYFGRASGYLLGAGMEAHVAERLVLGGELLHHRFPDLDGSGDNFSANTLTARLSYRF